jgi:hypothetical protein
MKSLIANWIFSIIAVLGFAVPAFALSGENAGHVVRNPPLGALYTLNGQQVYEVQLNGSDGRLLGTLCPGHNFAYIATTDNNVNVVLQAMQLADQHSSNLYVFWTTDATGNCHITRVYW